MSERSDLDEIFEVLVSNPPTLEALVSGLAQDFSPMSCQEQTPGADTGPGSPEQQVQFLRSLLEASPDGTMVIEVDGHLSSINAAGCRTLDVELPSSVLGRDWVTLWPTDSAESVRQALNTALEGQPACFEGLRTTRSGSSVWWDMKVVPVLQHGRVQRVMCVARDITERKRAEQRAAILISESHHRVKNTLATVQAIARSTLRMSESLGDFEEEFNGRLVALANTHDLLMRDVSDVADLERLLRSELDPYDDGTGCHVRLEGPSVTLSAEVAVPFGMVIHELTTNAVKYGALSVQLGSVVVSWSLAQDKGQQRLHLRWIEKGGPEVGAPTRHGFGSQLLDRVLRGHPQMTAEREFAPEGFRATVEIALA